MESMGPTDAYRLVWARSALQNSYLIILIKKQLMPINCNFIDMNGSEIPIYWAIVYSILRTMASGGCEIHKLCPKIEYTQYFQ